MYHFRKISAAALLASAALVAGPVSATTLLNGTVSFVGIFSPAVNMSGTVSSPAGSTVEIAGAGSFVGATGGFGTLNGLLPFSTTVGTTVAAPLANYFTFSGGPGVTYKFSSDSVKTLAYVNQADAKSATLYLLGNTVDALGNYSATPTKLTLTVNATGGSAYSLSGSLATVAVPEPATWALMIGGFGLAGTALRRRAAKVRFA